MQKQEIHNILGSLAEGNPVELVKGVVIGYDVQGTLRLYNADMSQEELIVACEMTKAKAMGLINMKDMPSLVARQMAAQVQRAGGKTAPEVNELSGTKVD
jgi:hypothetical protein